MTDYADQLIAELDAATTWPLPREVAPLRVVTMWRAFRRASSIRYPYDRQLLLEHAQWEQRQEMFVGPIRREYVIDPLPRVIARAYADFLFGAAPTITAADETDQPWIGLLEQENTLAAKLHRAETVVASEGEAWWHVYTDRDIASAPLVDWCSRLAVVPLWRGDHLLAVGFVTDVAVEESSAAALAVAYDGSSRPPLGATVWRHIEVHATGRAVNLLFCGDRGTLGQRVSLDSRPETAGLAEEWSHGLPILAGRVVNEIDGAEMILGDSEFDRIDDLLLALNEARTIGAENTRLTAKKRLIIGGELVEADGTFDVGSDVFTVDPEPSGATMGTAQTNAPVAEAEYSYDADQLIKHVGDLEATILSRVGLVPQLVGRGIEGHSMSGTAIRLRFLPTENAAAGKARQWDDQLPTILHMLMLVDALPQERGGFSRHYTDLLSEPTVERGSILPRDDAEVVEENAVAVGAGIRSRETAVRDQHPEWTDDEVTAELDKINADEQLLGAPPPPPPGHDVPPASTLNRFAGRMS